MLRIAIDGATRRNGKPDCVAAGGVFIKKLSVDTGEVVETKVLTGAEWGSTNQRGELWALLTALEYVAQAHEEAQIITDSEYLFNCMTKGWIDRWMHNNWKTAGGDDVKNKALWQEIYVMYHMCEEVTFFHIKGHVIPLGKVTATNALIADSSGKTLYDVAEKQFIAKSPIKNDIIVAAQELSVKNNGFTLNPEVFMEFVVINTVADAIATKAVEEADRKI